MSEHIGAKVGGEELVLDAQVVQLLAELVRVAGNIFWSLLVAGAGAIATFAVLVYRVRRLEDAELRLRGSIEGIDNRLNETEKVGCDRRLNRLEDSVVMFSPNGPR